MEYEGKEKSPYHGVWIVCAVMIIVPFVFFGVLYWAMSANSSETPYACLYTSLSIGFALGSLTHLSFVIVGLFRGTFAVVINRWVEFFANAKISVKGAFRWYWQSVKHDGIVFWLYFVIIVATLVVTINSGINILTYYGLI